MAIVKATFDAIWGVVVSEIHGAMLRLRQAQKSSKGAAAYSRYVNRPLGRPLAATAFALRMTPSQVTIVSALCTLTGVALIALLAPTLWSSVLVCGLLVLGYALDSADGQLARLTGAGTLAGEWLDHFFDSLKLASIHLAVLVCWFRFYDLTDVWLLVPLGFAVVANTFFFGIIAADFLRRIHRLESPVDVVEAPREAWRSGGLYSLAVIPSDYGFLCLAFLLLWWQPGFVAVYTALAAVNAVLLVLAAFRWHRSIAGLQAHV